MVLEESIQSVRREEEAMHRVLEDLTRWALDNVLGWGLRVRGILRVS